MKSSSPPDRAVLLKRIDGARVTLDAVVLSAPTLTDAWRAWKTICQELDADVSPEDQEWMTKRIFELFAVFSQSTMFVTGRQRVAAQLSRRPLRDVEPLPESDEKDERCA